MELNPQGTLAERIRAGGAGIGGFYTPTGVGTVVAEGKETREIDGQMYLLEKPLRADLAIVRAAVGIASVTSAFTRRRGTSTRSWRWPRELPIAEVDELVDEGAIDPDDVHLPGALREADRPRRESQERHRIPNRPRECKVTWSHRRNGAPRGGRAAKRRDRESRHRAPHRGRESSPREPPGGATHRRTAF